MKSAMRWFLGSCLVVLLSVYLTAQTATWEEQNAAGLAAYEKKQFAEAEKHLSAAVKTAKRFGAKDLRLATSLGNLAAAIEGPENPSKNATRKAIKLYEAAFQICDQPGAPEAQKLQYARALSDALWAESEYKKARKYLELLAEEYERDPTASEEAARFSEFVSDLYAAISIRAVRYRTVLGGSGGWPTGPIAGVAARRAADPRVYGPGLNPGDVARASRGGVREPYPRGAMTSGGGKVEINGPLLQVAVLFRERALRIRDRVAPSDTATHNSRMALAGLYLAQGKTQTAKEIYQAIVAKLENGTNVDRKLQTWALMQLAETQHRLKERAAAGQTFQAAVAVAESEYGADGLQLIPPLLSYAAALRSEKRIAEAEQLEQRAEQIKQKARAASAGGATPK